MYTIGIMRFFMVVLLTVVCLPVSPFPVWGAEGRQVTMMREEPRYALMAGNSAYWPLSEKYIYDQRSKGRFLPKDALFLPNAANDMESLATAFTKKAGFSVSPAKNHTKEEFKTAVEAFVKSLQKEPKGVVLFFWSGHGMQIGGENYLIPIGGMQPLVEDPKADPDIYGVRISWLLKQLAKAEHRVNIVLLDACRDNPLTRRDVGKGFAQAKGEAFPGVGTFYIQTSSTPGQPAFDGPSGKHSPYGFAWLDILENPSSIWASGLSETTGFPSLLQKVAASVEQGTSMAGEPQIPHIEIRGSQLFQLFARGDGGRIAHQELLSSTELGLSFQEEVPVPVHANQLEKIAKAEAEHQATLKGIETAKRASLKVQRGMEFVTVSGGTFEIGCGYWPSCIGPENPVLTVNNFEIGKYEVTQGQWQAVMGSSFSSCGDDCPVVNVSFDDVQKFIQKLNANGGGRYRLPTEAEWEYACRSGGKLEKYCGGDNVDQVAWYFGNSDGKTHRVGQKSSNWLGIYDMSGNVLEWTCSAWGEYDDGRMNHAVCGGRDSFMVSRGGGWNDSPDSVRSSSRNSYKPDFRNSNLGFRLVRTYPGVN